MSSEHSSDMKFEIGHVLFIDIVGYSKLLINEQSNHLQTLKEIVRGTKQVLLAEAEGKILRLSTGDGGALVFRNSPEAPVLCAMAISKALQSHPELRVRMGIHSGPVNEVTDLNEQANIAGAGINIAQRVMDCGDAGHILLSRHVAEDLEHYPRWQGHLHELGECEVKHGVRMSVVNLYNEEVGNPTVPERFRKEQAVAPPSQPMVSTSAKPSLGLVLGIVSLAALAILAVLVVPRFFRSRDQAAATNTAHSNDSSTIPVSAKSIAVLPFNNLSSDKENAYFAEGIQDEILTRLAKVSDLKVISRTSTQRFKSAPSDLREIAKQLGVMNILEGSVQKSSDQVRVNVQLINAMTDGHLWAEIYDRKLTDIFGVESEIAKAVADTLQAKLTGSEETAMTKKPTANPEAYQLYLQGRYFWNKRTASDLQKSIEYFNKATEKDPNYALAYAAAAQALLLLPAYDGGAPNDCFPRAKIAAEKALSLDQTSSEAQTALASLKALYEFDFPAAIAGYERAIQLNPNDATTHHWLGNQVLAATGQVERELTEVRRALELDPLSLIINSNIGQALIHARRYDDAIAQLRKTLELDGNFYYARYTLGTALEMKGSTAEAIAEYQRAAALSDDPFPKALLGHIYAACGQRAEALQILQSLRERREKQYTDAYTVAIVNLGLGNQDEAIKWLEQGYRDHDGFNIGPIRIDPLLESLHGNPRFEALAEKIVPAREFGHAGK